MEHIMTSPAFSSAESVRDIALSVMRMSEAIHNALRQLTSTSQVDQATTSPYALLTEEYALRARANMLLIEAARLVRPGFPISQGAVLDILKQVETRLSQSTSLDEMGEVMAALFLFTSSIISRRNQIISTLLDNLAQTVTSPLLTFSSEKRKP
jgi:hypothetical protein